MHMPSNMVVLFRVRHLGHISGVKMSMSEACISMYLFYRPLRISKKIKAFQLGQIILQSCGTKKIFEALVCACSFLQNKPVSASHCCCRYTAVWRHI